MSTAAEPAGPAAGTRWQRVHPVTPVVKAWKALAVVVAIAAQQAGQNLGESGRLLAAGGPLGVLGVVAAVLVVGFAWSAVAWRFTRYAVDAEAIHLHTGVIARSQRQARLDRLQAVDVVQPFLARLLGLAELRIEVAGGNDSVIKLAFLKEDEAQHLRNSLLARAAGLREEEGAPAPAAPERTVAEVPPGRLVASLLLSPTAIVVVVLGLGLLVVSAVTRTWLLVGLAPGLLGAAGYLWQRFSREFGFVAATSPDGLRLRHGLLEARSQTVPPGRVQALRVCQPLLWRGRDWWRVELNVAGYASRDQGEETVLLPVGTREEALLAIWLVLPDLGTDDPAALLRAGLVGAGPERGFTTNPPAARWLDPLAWRRNGVAVTTTALLVRTGRLHRVLTLVPHERTQSLALRQGPLQRGLGLASLVVHSTPGPVRPVVPHLAARAAGELLTAQARRARAARATALPEQWMRPAGGPA